MANCKSCGKHTIWVHQNDGRWLMCNSIADPDGPGPHFKTCPGKKYDRQNKKPHAVKSHA